MFHNLRTEVKRFKDRPRGNMIAGLPTIKACPYALDRLLAEYDRLCADNETLKRRDGLFVEAFSEAKAIADGHTEQTIQQVVIGLIEELPPYPGEVLG